MELAAATVAISRPKLQIPDAGIVGKTADMYLDGMSGARTPAVQVFDAHPRLLIVGGAGTGKTTLLRARAFEMASAYLDNPASHLRVHVLIVARNLPASNHSVSSRDYVATLAHYCQVELGVDVDPALLEEHLRTGRIELLVDGVDELGGDWNQTVSQLSDLFRAMPNLRGAITSRPATLAVRFTDFAAFTMADLDLAQIEHIVREATLDRPELRDGFVEGFRTSTVLSALARSPLLLRVMLSIFVEMGSLPTSGSLLYSSAIDVILRRWEARSSPLRPEQTRFVLSDVYAVLGAVAAHMFSSNEYTISRDALGRIAGTVLVPPTQLGPDLEASLFSTGLIAPSDGGAISFAHKSFVEYFTAWSYRNDIPALLEIMSREDGEAVLKFASGIVDDPGVLVESAVARNQLVLAANMASAGRFDSDALRLYVAQAFRKALDPSFIALLAPPQEDRSDTRREDDVAPFDDVQPDDSPEPAGASSSEGGSATDEDRLLSMLDDVRHPEDRSEVHGRRFEEFTSTFFSRVFRVADANYLTNRGEIDIVLELEPGGVYWAEFGNEALVECKNLKGKVDIGQAATFITKVKQARRRLGFIVSHTGFTTDALRSLQHNVAEAASPVIIPIASGDIRKSLQRSENTNEFLKTAYQSVTMPKRGQGRGQQGNDE